MIRLIHDNRSYCLNSRQQTSATTDSILDGKTDQYFKVNQCDLDYIPLRPTFVSLIFYFLQSVYCKL